MKVLSAIGLVVALLLEAGATAAATPQEQMRQTVDQILAVLQDPQLQGEAKKAQRRKKLEQLISQRFDFNEMAKRALGPEWQRRTPDERKQFVELFTSLLENAYLDKIESYSGEKVRYLKERQDGDFAEVATEIVSDKGEAFAVNYRLRNVNGDWKVYDVAIEDVSLVNNYRAQFRRVLERSSFDELLRRMREKQFGALVPSKKK